MNQKEVIITEIEQDHFFSIFAFRSLDLDLVHDKILDKHVELLDWEESCSLGVILAPCFDVLLNDVFVYLHFLVFSRVFKPF